MCNGTCHNNKIIDIKYVDIYLYIYLDIFMLPGFINSEGFKLLFHILKLCLFKKYLMYFVGNIRTVHSYIIFYMCAYVNYQFSMSNYLKIIVML